MASPEVYNAPSDVHPVHLGTEHYNIYDQLTSIGFYNGEIGLREYDPDDVNPVIIALTAADFSRTQIKDYFRQQPIGITWPFDTVCRYIGLDRPNGALNLVTHAWRKGILQVNRPITLPNEYTPDLQAISPDIKRILGSLFAGNSLACTQQLEAFKYVQVARNFTYFKDAIGVASDAAALSFGLLSLKRRSGDEAKAGSGAAVPQQSSPEPVIVATPEPITVVIPQQAETKEPNEFAAAPADAAPEPPPVNAATDAIPQPRSYKGHVKVPHTLYGPRGEQLADLAAYTNTCRQTILELGQTVVAFELTDVLSCPRSAPLVVEGLVDASHQAIMNRYQKSRNDLRAQLELARQDILPGSTYRAKGSYLPFLNQLVHSGKVLFSHIPAQTEVQLDDNQKYVLQHLARGNGPTDILNSTSWSQAQVGNAIRSLKVIFDAASPELIYLSAIAQGALLLPEGAKAGRRISTDAADTTIPDRHPAPIIEGNRAHWAGGILRAAIPESENLPADNLSAFLRFCCDTDSGTLAYGPDAVPPTAGPKYTLRHLRLPARSNAAISELFRRGWLGVEQSSVMPSKLYRQEVRIIRHLPNGDTPAIAAAALGMAEKAYATNVREVSQASGIKNPQGLLTLAYLASIIS